MAILDDEEANGFLFKYEKLFGAVELSVKDRANEAEGNDSTQFRTRRLFYVICSRTEKSLAVVAYTQNPQAVRNHAVRSGWFREDEVVLM
jgi:DNA helicase-2/ATP-dependent DNA helicase PcrA